MSINPLSMSEQLKLVRPIDGISSDKNGIANVGDTAKSGKASFSDFLMKQLKDANDLGVEAEKSIQRTLEGKESNPHSALIAIQKASISLTLLMGVKQRLERVYQELIRTPL